MGRKSEEMVRGVLMAAMLAVYPRKEGWRRRKHSFRGRGDGQQVRALRRYLGGEGYFRKLNEISGPAPTARHENRPTFREQKGWRTFAASPASVSPYHPKKPNTRIDLTKGRFLWHGNRTQFPGYIGPQTHFPWRHVPGPAERTTESLGNFTSVACQPRHTRTLRSYAVQIVVGGAATMPHSMHIEASV